MIRVGVVGTGMMGQHHVRIYSENPDIELVGIADTDKERAQELAKKYKTKIYTDYKKLLDQKPDAVSIAVPTVLHKDFCLEAIKRGIHVLVEKPIADTIENGKEIMAAAKEKGLVLMVGHIERFNPVVERLKKHIDAGKLGQIVHMTAKRVGPFNPRIKDVGIIIDVGVHDIDIMSYLYSSPIQGTYAIAGNGGSDIETYAHISLKFANGGSGIIETNRLTPNKIRELHVTGTKGVARADYINQSLEIQDGQSSSQEEIVKEEPLKREIDHFIECVRDEKDPSITAEDGIHALEVACAAINSYSSNSYNDITKPALREEVFYKQTLSKDMGRVNQNQHFYAYA
ncbi:Gfo/Idh/MocA family oxidoreductase [Candidatus Altiarchaeota archaeon]